MSIFSRFTDVFKSNVNFALDKMEDPEKMLNSYILDMEMSIEKTTVSVAKAIANKNNLKKKIDKAEKNKKEWDKKAKQAAAKDEDELAKEALVRYNIEESNIKSLKPMYDQAAKISDDLKQRLNEFKFKLDTARNKESILIARANQAKTQKEFNQILSNIDNGSGFSKFNKMETKIEDLESEAEAYSELADTDQSLEDRFNELNSVDIDEQLEALKKKVK